MVLLSTGIPLQKTHGDGRSDSRYFRKSPGQLLFVARFIPMNMHVCVCVPLNYVFVKCKYLAFCRTFAGKVLPTRFAVKNRQRLFACIVLFKQIHRNSTTNFTMHHGLKPFKKSAGRRHFLVQIYSLKFSWHGASVLMQCISERLTSPIAGLGGYSKDHVFFLPEKMAQAL